jgi:hypothetical protein
MEKKFSGFVWLLASSHRHHFIKKPILALQGVEDAIAKSWLGM